MMNIGGEVKFEEDNFEEEEEQTKQKSGFNLFQPLGFIANTAKTVVVDHAIGTATKIIKTGVNNIVSKKDHTNEEFIQAKKFNVQFDHIDPKVLKPRIVMGTHNPS
jgi:hypothetical protein